MTNERILNPAFVPGTAAAAHEAKEAASVTGLGQQRLALLVNAWPSWVQMADHLNERMTSTYDGLKITKYVVPNGSAAAPELLEEISRDNDIAVVGLANCGSCTAWSFHDSAELKKTGMPVVWVATNEFEGLARGLSDARRVPLPIVVLPKNPETIELPLAIAMMDDAFDAITSSLVASPVADDDLPVLVDTERHLAVKEGQSAQDVFYEQGLTDGLPVIIPTETEVATMLSGLADPEELIGNVPPTYFALNAETLAVNAVMAGAEPRFMPTIRAVVRAACVHEFNLNGIATTTGPSTPMVIVNGPVRDQIELNYGRGILGTGRKANATIGRTLRLVINNVGGAKPGLISKSLMGQPGRYTFCFGEDEDNSPWEPLAETLGQPKGTSAVTLMGVTGTMNILTPRRGPEDIIAMLADGLTNMASPNVIMGHGTVAVIITSGHAAVLAAGGYSKADVSAAIWAEAKIPLDRFPVNVRPDPPYEFIEKDGYVYGALDPAHILVIVAGGPEPTHATVVPSHPSSVPVTEPVL